MHEFDSICGPPSAPGIDRSAFVQDHSDRARRYLDMLRVQSCVPGLMSIVERYMSTVMSGATPHTAENTPSFGVRCTCREQAGELSERPFAGLVCSCGRRIPQDESPDDESTEERDEPKDEPAKQC